MLALRYPQGQDDAKAILSFLIPFWQEVGRADLDLKKSLIEINRVIAEEVALVVDDGGQMVGAVGLSRSPLWYADADILADQWFYVTPDQRGAKAARMLLDEAKRLAETIEMDLVFTLAPPRRSRKPRGPIDEIGSTLGYTVGRMLRIVPPS